MLIRGTAVVLIGLQDIRLAMAVPHVLICTGCSEAVFSQLTFVILQWLADPDTHRKR
ncbi:hypothetical protein KC19_VG277300 [Ceratodon purpureus]|uniref:Uncharacterized protein n=1 Tax=Ceratodon purpureus TaxID=3225 RepID=A0A8T0HVU4_CERPU|nr:hypothetical protein KC19_VG277300 [Ceratodon purpureus]